MANQGKGPNQFGNDYKICGAKRAKKPGELCRNPVGYGTDHLGYGRCKWHGGCTPAGNTYAAREQARELQQVYGGPVEVEPTLALLQEVHRTAGHVHWLQTVIQAFEGDDKDVLLQMSIVGYEKAAWVRLYQEERAHLARICKMALDAGVAERQVKLAESYAELMAQAIRGILGDLKLSEEQAEQAPAVVRRHLSLVSETQRELETG